MKMHHSVRTTFLGTLAALACGSAAAGSNVEKEVAGLWFYTGLMTSDGVERPLSGVFLFKDGVFIQQAVFDGDSFEEQGAMAHAGPYRPEDGWVYLLAQQTISTAPGQETPYAFRRDTEHEVTVDRSGDELTLIFSMGSGTVQRFERVGPGEGDLHVLENGALALVDGHFALVVGDEDASVSGYGTFEQDGDALTLNVIRWTEADGSSATNRRDVSLTATFDGDFLVLEDGRSFSVAR